MNPASCKRSERILTVAVELGLEPRKASPNEACEGDEAFQKEAAPLHGEVGTGERSCFSSLQ